MKLKYDKLKKRILSDGDIDAIEYQVCKTFGWDYHTLMNQPIPFVNRMLRMMRKESLKEREMFKKSNRKR